MALHVAEVTTVSKKQLATLRTASVRAVWSKGDQRRKMRSADLSLNLATAVSDSEFWLIRARGLGLRNWVARSPADMECFQRVARVWDMDEKSL